MNGTALGLASLLVSAATTAWWFRTALALRLPANRTPWIVGWIVAAALGVAALTQGAGWLGGVPAVLGLVSSAFLLFTIAISAQAVAPDAVTVGASLPDFEALDDAGNTVTRASLAGSALLLKFFRGHW